MFDFLKKKKEDINKESAESLSGVSEEVCVQENIDDISEKTNADNEEKADKLNDADKEKESGGDETDVFTAETGVEESIYCENKNEQSGTPSGDDENGNITENFEENPEKTVIETEKNPEAEEIHKEKKGFFAKLKEGLNKTRNSILGGVDSVLGAFTKIDEDLFEELEEILIMADLGVETTMSIIENLRKRVKKEGVTDPSKIKGMLAEEITSILTEGTEDDYELNTPAVLLVIGVNGVGKTTTIGKLCSNLKSDGKSVLLAAADTFRAAAIDQLEVWGKRSGTDIIKHEENSDPAAVVFDAVNAAKNRKTDVLICDTAGRLHNKKNLMEELKKISKVIEREYPQANRETYLVLDATTGQNALQQAKLFKEVADITGIVLTKLDGTAKGGIVVAIKNELKIPVRYIGVGEGIGDLQKFNAENFAKALFGDE
ncbi:signal recognition particle-docking protein FtsY [Anaerotignum faecicola]|nr:signal recognition particle-docking protein FtsY [Anaerotignum faecicola]